MSAQAGPSTSSREATENGLLDALEAVLLRDGLRNLSVNAVVKEAGVGKPLLYRYFGDLPGLVKAWADRRGFWMEVGDYARPRGGHEPPAAAEDDAAFRRRIADELVATAEHLRTHPVTLEFLAEELTARSDLSDAFDGARDDHRRPFLKAMLTDPRYLRRDNRRAITVLYAAVTYLAMRSRRSPRFMGLRLDTDEGWRDAMEMVREVAALLDIEKGTP